MVYSTSCGQGLVNLELEFTAGTFSSHRGPPIHPWISSLIVVDYPFWGTSILRNTLTKMVVLSAVVALPEGKTGCTTPWWLNSHAVAAQLHGAPCTSHHDEKHPQTTNEQTNHGTDMGLLIHDVPP